MFLPSITYLKSWLSIRWLFSGFSYCVYSLCKVSIEIGNQFCRVFVVQTHLTNFFTVGYVLVASSNACQHLPRWEHTGNVTIVIACAPCSLGYSLLGSHHFFMSLVKTLFPMSEADCRWWTGQTWTCGHVTTNKRATHSCLIPSSWWTQLWKYLKIFT